MTGCCATAVIIVLVLGGPLVSAADAVRGQTAANDPSAAPGAETLPAAPPIDDLEDLLDQLGHDDYEVREAATRAVLKLGESIIPGLRARLRAEADPEIRYRLRFILENIRPPDQAVLVVRPDPAGVLQPGELITHVNNRRVRGTTEFRQRMREARAGTTLRVRGPAGPRDVGPLVLEELPELADYRAPRGETIARVLRLYHAGYAERAYELLGTLEAPVPVQELSPLLRTVIAYTAGEAATAYRVLVDYPAACQPQSLFLPWRSPSQLDRAGPFKAPFHLEWRLWTAPGSAALDPPVDPDLAVQRVLVPANRFPDALQHVAILWFSQYRPNLGSGDDTDRVAGNTLAVSAWMLSEMELLSECLRLIEPRSQILRSAPSGVRKWVRVRTDAWLPFVHGDARQALDGFYEDARTILQPPGPPAARIHIQNPRVAAVVAFFLYQFPADERAAEMFELVNRPEHPALADYAYWMMYALREENFDLVREHLLRMLPQAPGGHAAALAHAVAVLEYVREKPDREVLAAARQRWSDSTGDPERGAGSAVVAALEHLAAGRIDEASAALEQTGPGPGVAALRTTAEFLAAPPPGAADLPALGAPLLAVPIGPARGAWLVLTRRRQLVRFRPDTGELTRVEKLSPTWFPGPLNWPWLGREESTGRVWVYGRRRVAEVCGAGQSPLILNIRPDDIPAFDHYIAPVFTTLAQAVAAAPPRSGESGEFWREDLRAGIEYFADPELPEIGLIRPLPDDRRIVHVALRGGPHLLLEPATGTTWTSLWIGERLGLEATPRFLAQAARERPTPVVFLMSDAGLIRFDVAGEKLKRLELPGDDAHPELVPEWCPYDRRDPRWVYCARLPRDGGQVFRVTVADNAMEVLDMVNEALPRDYCLTRSRCELREQVDGLLTREGLPPLREFVADAEQTVARHVEEKQP